MRGPPICRASRSMRRTRAFCTTGYSTRSSRSKIAKRSSPRGATAPPAVTLVVSLTTPNGWPMNASTRSRAYPVPDAAKATTSVPTTRRNPRIILRLQSLGACRSPSAVAQVGNLVFFETVIVGQLVQYGNAYLPNQFLFIQMPLPIVGQFEDSLTIQGHLIGKSKWQFHAAFGNRDTGVQSARAPRSSMPSDRRTSGAGWSSTTNGITSNSCSTQTGRPARTRSNR